jgi:predicted RNA-binding protein Jag
LTNPGEEEYNKGKKGEMNMTEHEETVLHYMKTLDLTREQAEALIVDDENDITTELTTEQAKVAKEMTRADRKKEMTTRKRERKIDQNRRFLIDSFVWALTTDTDEIGDNVFADNVVVTNPEREITFEYKGEKYQLTLVKKRKEKN